MENKSPASVSTTLRRLAISRLRVPNLDGVVPATTGNLLSIGAPRHWTDLEIVRSHHTNQQNQRGKNWKNLQFRVPSQRRSPSTRKTYVFESLTFLFFEDILISKKLPFRAVVHTGHSDRNMIDLVIFRAYWSKTTYMFECPVSVDWQSPDCESQILIVRSLLPLAIRFPSGLHATEKTLKLWQVRTRINKNREGYTRIKELDLENVQVRVPGQRRLAISRLWVPNLDCEVPTAAGNSFSIGAQRHRKNTEIVTSQDTNQQKQRGIH